ncbi:MAG: shikimate kinase [SAR116 cluster bacterium]|jgi:shikimate kinase|nr:shikimate kinase [SAR116 cluster bacterium]RPG96597.1 MAG: shikimate kinase [Candidatus Puniceispirillum sp. TMED176]RZO31018.1 MAG: shikimate kinase [SAR116 cluster bacterium]
MHTAMPIRHSAMPDITALTEAIDRPIALVGMMGSGKSLVGRRLAQRLDLPFIDSDTEIEATAGITITEIFELAGEDRFRALERNTISAAADTGPSVLSTGGGSICTPETAQLLCDRTIVVWLQAKPETLLSRIGSISSRPLLHTDDPLATLRDLAERRAPDYGKAHITVTTDQLSAAAAVAEVLRALDSHLAVK